MRLLVELGLFKAVFRIGEVGAAVLFVLIEEEFVEIVLEIIMMSDVAPRSLQRRGAHRLCYTGPEEGARGDAGAAAESDAGCCPWQRRRERGSRGSRGALIG